MNWRKEMLIGVIRNKYETVFRFALVYPPNNALPVFIYNVIIQPPVKYFGVIKANNAYAAAITKGRRHTFTGYLNYAVDRSQKRGIDTVNYKFWFIIKEGNSPGCSFAVGLRGGQLVQV